MTPDITTEVRAICEKLGKDPALIAEITVTPEVVIFTEYVEPKQMGADGPLTVIDTQPWRL